MAKKKILVVDDETEVLDLIIKKLTVEGYEVAHATEGLEALDKARRFVPDLIIIDIMLPDIDGAEAIALVRQEESLKKVAVLFLSGIVTKTDGGEQKLGLYAAGWRYPAIAKPFNFQDLLAEVRQLCPQD